jgi:ubiquinone/menaquinone biosynthesis C-methylase UbiE
VPDHAHPAPAHRVRFVHSLDPVDSALDLGCGDGRLSAEIKARDLTVADVSAVALERAARRVPDATRAELSPDAPLPFADSSFDLVLCAETLEHVRDLQLLISEARRVLRPGGALAVTTPAHGRADGVAIVASGFESRFEPMSPHIRFLTRRSLRELLDGMGFLVRSLERRSGTLFAVATR